MGRCTHHSETALLGVLWAWFEACIAVSRWGRLGESQRLSISPSFNFHFQVCVGGSWRGWGRNWPFRTLKTKLKVGAFALEAAGPLLCFNQLGERGFAFQTDYPGCLSQALWQL